MSHSSRNLLITIHDAPLIAAAVRERLAAAPEQEVAGLRRALELVEGFDLSEAQLRQRWFRDTLEQSDVTSGDSDVEAIRKVRAAHPAMKLATAVDIVTQTRAMS